MSRIIAFDVGKKRVGIAATDKEKIIANSLTTLPIADVLPFIEDYLSKEPVALFVIGFARHTTGEESESMKYIRPFAKSLNNKFPSIPIEWVDERFTSKIAFQTMIEGGVKKMKRQNKALIDKISATIILQSFLEKTRCE
ncbi:MAG: Holliday junction resolvase RuvX [Marinilabiliaceae bacterium]|nr:Holliday junction resolvase RuvX [Marinilabiliaceae bacterium]